MKSFDGLGSFLGATDKSKNREGKECPECGSNNLVRNYTKRELFCADCGLVIDGNLQFLPPRAVDKYGGSDNIVVLREGGMNIRKEAEVLAQTDYGRSLDSLPYHIREALYRKIRHTHHNSTVAPSKSILEAREMSYKFLSKYFSDFYIAQRISEADDENIKERNPGGVMEAPNIPVYIVDKVCKEYAKQIRWYRPTKRIHKEDIITYLTIKFGMKYYGPLFSSWISQEDIETYTKVGLNIYLKRDSTSAQKDSLFNDKKYPYTLKNKRKVLKCVDREYWFLLFPLASKKFFELYRIPPIFSKLTTHSLREGLRQSNVMTWSSGFPVRDWSYLASVLYDLYYLILKGESCRKANEYAIRGVEMGMDYEEAIQFMDKTLSEEKSDIDDNFSLLDVFNLSPMDTVEIFKNRKVYHGITSVRETAKIFGVPKGTLSRRFREIETCRIASAKEGEEIRKKMGLDRFDKQIKQMYENIEYDEWIKIMEKEENIWRDERADY